MPITWRRSQSTLSGPGFLRERKSVDNLSDQGLRQEVIVDLVEQCRTYKQRVVHLVNSTSDESLLCQGLALNDDLQRVLTKHEALVSGTSLPSDKPKTETSQALVPVDTLLIDTEDTKQPGRCNGELRRAAGASVQWRTPTSRRCDGELRLAEGATANSDEQQVRRSTSVAAAGAEADLLAITVTTNGPPATPTTVNAKFDLLSGDDFSSPTPENSLAIVPTGEPTSSGAPASSQNNALALVDMLSQNNVPNGSAAGQTYSSPQFQQSQNFPSNQNSLYANASIPNTVPPQYDNNQGGSTSSWNGHMPQQQPLQDPPLPAYGHGFACDLHVDEHHVSEGGYSKDGKLRNTLVALHLDCAPTSEGLPPPPWEAQSTDDNQSGGPQYSQPHMLQTNDQGMGMYLQPPVTGGGSHLPPLNHHQPQAVYPQQQFQGQQMMGMIPNQQIQMQPAQMYSPQMQIAPQMQMAQQYGYGYGYGYGQQQNGQFLDQRMAGLSVGNDTVYTGPSMANASYVHVPSGKPMKAEDKLFGDLVDFAKVKPKTTPGRAGSKIELSCRLTPCLWSRLVAGGDDVAPATCYSPPMLAAWLEAAPVRVWCCYELASRD
ncbi:hypothetical protein OSB04_019718, partial [Centaurea solstitialis]